MFKSVNPYNQEEFAQYKGWNDSQLDECLRNSELAFQDWRKLPLDERCTLLRNAGEVLRADKERYALMITREMGKVLGESRAEVDKCAWVCDYYAEKAPEFLKENVIEIDASKSYVRMDPLGTILAIMPWNFPFWQVFRFAAPSLTAGNAAILKHASNVLGCGQLIEEVFLKAGYPEFVFQHALVSHDQIEEMIAHDATKAVSLTGSERAGVAVAQTAGKYLKKCLLELGGSNAFVVLDDADLELTIQTAVKARMLNAGQSCIAAKRFIVADSIYEEFMAGFKIALSKLSYGDPLAEETDYGPMAREDLAEELQGQMKKSIEMGAKLVMGGEQEGAMHELTVLENVKPGMPAFDEETFGPLVAVVRAKDEDEAIELAKQTRYGLGLSIFSKDTERAEALVPEFADGAVFINELVKSDPRLPFGGTKLSGYGRELAQEGILEFVNKKTVYVK